MKSGELLLAEALYLEDSYLKECDAGVASVKDRKYVVLDRTLFYPQGGGQPWDTGRMITEGDQHKVVYVGKFSGEISHEVDHPGLEPGDKVHCMLNWDRRYRLMRSHTAAHVYASLVCQGTDALVTGNKLGEEKVRFDFSLEEFDRQIFKEYVEEANQLFMKDIPVKCYWLPREEALQIPGVIKMDEALPPDIPRLRIVEIVGIDKQADGGTHVKNLKEVGQIKFLKAINKGKDNRRVYFKLLP
ncbi:alanyl-tRNA editing protein AlaX [Candidatus Bathyarchaeota archaeon]|nr:alanyl-tRNA editing protein [Candidatus Bathyarchaeota archaeon]NIU81102.1 alanyl-tRNA editing protein AlaX [Candidatus Bathyarchaeota archaeon]NIV67738.1 alanyl-tRNA editing protein AlaX [Candidatus Bathyarchaeota archaeon]